MWKVNTKGLECCWLPCQNQVGSSFNICQYFGCELKYLTVAVKNLHSNGIISYKLEKHHYLMTSSFTKYHTNTALLPLIYGYEQKCPFHRNVCLIKGACLVRGHLRWKFCIGTSKSVCLSDPSSDIYCIIVPPLGVLILAEDIRASIQNEYLSRPL